MKASSEKSSVTATATPTRQPAGQPFFAKAGGGNFFAPAAVPAVQMKMTVNKPGDALEGEADRMADKVMRMPDPAAPVQEEKLRRQPGDKLQKKAEDKIQNAPAPEEKVQRAAAQEDQVRKKEDDKLQKAPEEGLRKKEDDKLRKKEDDKVQRAPAPEEKVARKEEVLARKGDNVPAVGSDTQAAIRSRTTGGQPLSAEMRRFMEPRFGADFGNVRIHHDAEAARLGSQLSARAFTYRNHVFFARGQYQPGTSEGRHLLAHELTHTIQQGHAVQRSPQVSTTAAAPPIQRWGVSDALEHFAEAAYHIPGFRMFTVVVGVNPITMQATDRGAANILRAVVELWPGGHLVTRVLDHYGVLERAGGFVEQQLNGLGITGSSIRAAITRFLDSLSWRDVLRLGSVWERAKAIFTEPISRIGNLIRGLFNAIKGFVWDAVLRPLAGLASQTRGYDLLKAVLGRDPITGEAYPRTAETLIGGFMKLIGQEEVWENIKRGNAVGRAWTWFQGALSELMGFVGQIPALFMSTLRSLELPDFLVITNAFRRIAGAFGNFVGNFFTWAGSKVMGLLEILFSVVAPGVMPFIRRAAGAFGQILRNPVRFVGNLVRAGMQGFRQFAGNILKHLRNGLVGWLTGALTGLTLPARWDFRGILSLVLQVLGVTWPQVRGRLVRVLGEPAMAVLERTFGLMMTLVREGPVAAWRELMGHLGNLQEMLFGQIREWIKNTIVGQAVMRIASLLTPAGAVVQAITAIYNTIMFFVERMRQIGAVVESVVNSLSAIAAGTLGPAANAIEQTLARLVPVAISFLARLIGLGGISERIQAIMRRIQQPISNAIDRVVDWIVAQARRLVRGVAGAVRGRDARTPEEQQRDLEAALNEGNALLRERVLDRVVRENRLRSIKAKYNLKELKFIIDEQKPIGEKVHIFAEVNPMIHGRPMEIDYDLVERQIEQPPFALIWHENRGGHTIQRHVDPTVYSLPKNTYTREQITERYLISRIYRDNTDEPRSVWKDQPTAERIISRVISGNETNLIKWLLYNDPNNDTFRLNYRGNQGDVLGLALMEVDGQIGDFNVWHARIILRKKDLNGQRSYFILTSYPE
jgi:hypothetical protein